MPESEIKIYRELDNFRNFKPPQTYKNTYPIYRNIVINGHRPTISRNREIPIYYTERTSGKQMQSSPKLGSGAKEILHSKKIVNSFD